MTHPLLKMLAELAADVMLEQLDMTFEELHQPLTWNHVDGGLHNIFGFSTEEEFKKVAATGKPNSYLIALLCIDKVKESPELSSSISKSFGFERPSELAEVMYNNLGKAELALLLAQVMKEADDKEESKDDNSTHTSN